LPAHEIKTLVFIIYPQKKPSAGIFVPQAIISIAAGGAGKKNEQKARSSGTASRP
jgi:hypothetical protein